jgi:hypothetical protein
MTTQLPEDPRKGYPDEVLRPSSGYGLLLGGDVAKFRRHIKTHLMPTRGYYSPKLKWTETALVLMEVSADVPKAIGLLARNVPVVEAPPLVEYVRRDSPRKNPDSVGNVVTIPSDASGESAEDTTMYPREDRSFSEHGPAEIPDAAGSRSNAAAPPAPPAPVKRRPFAMRMILPGLCAAAVVAILFLTVLTHTTYMSFIVFFPVIAALVAQRRTYKRRIERLGSSVIDEAEYVKQYYPNAYPAYYREAASALIERGAGYLVGKLPAK